MGPHRLLAIVLISAIGSTGYGLLSPAVTELAEAYGVTETSVGLLQGAVAVPGILLTIVVGLLCDRIGPGRIATVSLLLFATTGTACAFVDSFSVALALRIAQGIGFAGLLTVPPTVIGARLSGAARQRGLAVNTLVLTMASTLGPVLGGALASTGDPRNAFWAYTLGILALPSTIRVLGLRAGQSRGEMVRPRETLAALRERRAVTSMVGALALSTMTLWFVASTTTAILPLALERVYDVPLASRGIYIGLANIGSLGASAALAVLAGRLADRHVTIGGLILISLAMWTTSLQPPLWVLAIAMIVLGMGVSASYNSCLHHISRQEVPGRGMLVGAWSASSRLGQATGPLIGTTLVALLSPMSAFAALGLASLALIVALVLTVRRLAIRH
jgi:MFS family permease